MLLSHSWMSMISWRSFSLALKHKIIRTQLYQWHPPGHWLWRLCDRCLFGPNCSVWYCGPQYLSVPVAAPSWRLCLHPRLVWILSCRVRVRDRRTTMCVSLGGSESRSVLSGSTGLNFRGPAFVISASPGFHPDQAHGSFHCYPDNSQIYVPLKKKDAFCLKPLLLCLKAWMSLNFLKFHEKKTEVMVFGPSGSYELGTRALWHTLWSQQSQTWVSRLTVILNRICKLVQ